MDPRHQSQDLSGANAQRSGGSYAYNGAQSDPFNAFVHTENDSAFDTSWGNQSLPGQPQPVNGYDQGHHTWPQDPYQSPDFLGTTSSFGPPQRAYDPLQQTRSPSAFNYSSYDQSQSQPFSSNAYDPQDSYNQSLTYVNPSLNSNNQYDYSESALAQRDHQTISPQALQNYPASFPNPNTDDSRHAYQPVYDANLPVRRGPGGGSSQHRDPNWIALARATSASISAKGLHIKPTTGLSNATRSTRVDGFVFVGNDPHGTNIIKAKVSRNDRKRSLKTLRRLFETEKGNEPWAQERGHIMKKIKLTESKLGSRPTKSKTQSRSGSVAESTSSSQTSDSESEDDSAYDSESDVEMELEEPSPLPASRPADPNKAVEYDVIKAVWAKRSVGLSGTVIRTALGEYWNVFKGIRDKWKSRATSLQQSIDKKDQANVKTYERRVVEQRRLLESCIGLTLKHGHPDIVEKLGMDPAFLLIFYQFLADRFKESEYTGSLIASVLELMTRCATIDQAILEKTKLDKVLPRIVKRGDEQGKNFAQKILDHATNVSTYKDSTEKSGGKQKTNGTSSKAISTDLKVSKHERTDATKVKAESSSRGPTLATAAKTNSTDNRHPQVKVDAKGTVKPAVSDGASTKIKTNQITAKPTSFFAGLKSASKKPGTSAKSEEGKTSTTPDSKSGGAAPQSKSGFSFAATMAALDAQKEAPPVKVEEQRKPETAEEKRKRLRKEERRKLRVSFKADDDLVQIREFVHDPEEELGHEDSQVRDVKDTRGEGQMLKMHKDLDMDEDEDYEPPEEIVLPDWTIPQPIEFGVIDEQDLARNYTNRGGKLEVQSAERTAQEQRELSTLMAIYTNPSDIPHTPREPSDLFLGQTTQEESFGAPEEKTKEREAQYNVRRNAQAPAPTAPVPDISALLRIMQNQNPPQPSLQQTPQPVAAAAPSAGLESIFAQFAKSNVQQAPPMQQPPQQPVPGFNLQAALANMQPAQAQTGYGIPAQVPNLEHIFAQIGNPSVAQAPMQNFGYGNQYDNDNDRKRQYEQDDNDQGRKRQRGDKPLPYKVKVCKYWQEGRCRRGDDCSYLHE